MTKWQGSSTDNGFIFEITNWNQKSKEKENPVSGNWNNPIHPLLSTWREPEAPYEKKVQKGLFFTTSNEVIWLKKNSNFKPG